MFQYGGRETFLPFEGLVSWGIRRGSDELFCCFYLFIFFNSFFTSKIPGFTGRAAGLRFLARPVPGRPMPIPISEIIYLQSPSPPSPKGTCFRKVSSKRSSTFPWLKNLKLAPKEKKWNYKRRGWKEKRRDKGGFVMLWRIYSYKGK